MTLQQIAILVVLICLASANGNSTNLYGKRPYSQCCDYKTITAVGSAQVQANPDQAILQASISRNGATVSQAINNLAIAVNSIIGVLNSSGLTSDDYFSTSFSVYPNTSYVNGTTTVVGQIANQAFQITLPIINNNGSNIGQLIDSLATVDGIVISSLTFDIRNKTDVYVLARQQAYVNAQQKAVDYTSALGLSVMGLVSLTDTYSGAPTVTPSNNQFMQQTTPSTPTQVNVGVITISYSLSAVFSFS